MEPRRLLLTAAALVACAACGRFDAGPPLIGAARSGDLGEMRRLLDAGADPNATGGVNGWTVLQHAVHKNQAAAVRLLLERDADPNLAPPSNVTALMMAAGYGQAEIVRILLQAGADPRQRNGDGRTALDFAVSGMLDIDLLSIGECNAPTVRLLVEAAADVHARRDLMAKTAGLFRSRAGCAEVERLVHTGD